MSRIVITGNDRAQASPVAGLSSCGPVLPMQPPSTFAQIRKYRSVSSTRPGPTIVSHQPGFAVIGCGSAAYWSPVNAWHTKTALDRSRSEERRVGKECRSRWSPDQSKKKEENDKDI